MFICFGKTQLQFRSRCSGFSVLIFVSLLMGIPKALSQSGPPLTDTPVPTAIGKVGQPDAGALSEVLEHIRAVGAAPWTEMEGKGQITYGGDSATNEATLIIVGNSRFRLDAQTSTGTSSIRINGRSGKIREADGHTFPLLPETAASGLFQFQTLRLADFPDASTSLSDRGLATIRKVSLHRITVERRLFPAQKKSVVTDFYFDPQTHLLVKSVNSIRVDGTGNNAFLRVITYEDYRRVDGVMIPFRFTQTLDGQKQWTLQLSDVQLKVDQPSTFLEF